MAFMTFYDVTDTDKQQLSELLKDTDHHWEFVEESISLENLKPESEAISVFVSSTVTREIIEALPQLRLVASRSTGFNHIDLDACRERDITVTNVPTYGNHTVAEYAFGLMLALTRKLLPAVEAVAHGRFLQHALTGIDLHGRTLGIVGAGKIGQAVARIARGFEMEVIAFDPYPNEEAAAAIGYQYTDFDGLLASSDIVTVHSPFTGDNRHLINEEALGRMKPGALLINTARGELVDTKALLSALQDRHLGGAALDVFEGEKLVDIDEELLLFRKDKLSDEVLEQSFELLALQKLPNVILSPHNAFNTVEAIQRINDTVARNLIRYWYGDAPDIVKN